MTTQPKLSVGKHSMSVFGDEFDDISYCWMMESGELWLSLIIVRKECRHGGVLHRLLEIAKDMSEVVVIPEPMPIISHAAEQHGYTSAKRWIEECAENMDVMEWKGRI